ncbi:mechanosensitive ion channel domain-containing protein [Microbacterium koreense]|uniref:Mechanosensitive ion channel domain-containing protein n=1 Tax=Microbacterium koreense TaxID=323761 RepID=A0ABW2ZP85_9MICO
MIDIGVDASWAWWAAAIAVGIPVLLVVFTEVLGALTRRNSPAARPVRLLRNWVIPVTGLLALLIFALNSPAENVAVRVVATVLGFLVILLLLSTFNVALFTNARAGSWRRRFPSIFVEIARLILVVVGVALLFQWVWGADVGGLIAALGVTSIILGLALQNAVGGIISGLLLLFEQPFKLGDWLELEGILSTVRGRVIEMNWRAVHLDTGSGIQVVPSSELSTMSFTNRSRPAGPHVATTTVMFASGDAPHDVTAVLGHVAASVPHRVAAQPADITYRGAGEYHVGIALMSPAVADEALSAFHSRLWYAARRRRLSLDGEAAGEIDDAMFDRAVRLVGAALEIDDEGRELVRADARLEQYGAGEIVLALDELPDEVRFIIDGEVTLSLADAAPFTVVESGDFVGHGALTREPARETARADGVVTILTVPLTAVDELLRTRPALATEIGRALEIKRRRTDAALADGAGGSLPA